MIFTLRRYVWCALFGACFILPATATSATQPSDMAARQARYIASTFPGRMTGTPVERRTAEYLQQQFTDIGYQSDIRKLDVRYRYHKANKQVDWHMMEGNMVIAAKKHRHHIRLLLWLTSIPSRRKVKQTARKNWAARVIRDWR